MKDNNQPADDPNKKDSQTKIAPFGDFNSLPDTQRKFRILLVDDTPDILSLLEVYLKHEGYTVQTANSGKQALDILDEFAPDVICMDFLMPAMDGQELARHIRERKDMLYVPIVMLTAVSGTETVKYDSLKSGVDAFLTKPVKREELKVVIRTMLRMKVAQDNVLAALERVAQVQDELLEFERRRGQFEAMEKTIETFNYELTAPLNSAETAANKLERLLTLAATGKIESTRISGEGHTYIKDLQQALSQAKESLKALSEKSKKASREFVQQRFQP